MPYCLRYMTTSFKQLPDHVIRGFMIKLYPSPEQEKVLKDLETCNRVAWNYLVRQEEDRIAACEAFAVREGLVPPRPPRSDYDGMSPEESSAARNSYRNACVEWKSQVISATKNVPACARRSVKDQLEHFGVKHDYQLLIRVVEWASDRLEVGSKPKSHVLQAVAKNYQQKSKRRSKLLPAVAKAEVIKVEKLQPKIGQMGSSKVSAMRLVKQMLAERYGEERVREV